MQAKRQLEIHLDSEQRMLGGILCRSEENKNVLIDDITSCYVLIRDLDLNSKI
jgi:hypothetical protein